MSSFWEPFNTVEVVVLKGVEWWIEGGLAIFQEIPTQISEDKVLHRDLI